MANTPTPNDPKTPAQHANAATPLPERPSLAYLKKLAKERLRELHAEDPQARLAHAQLEVAREHGFTSWLALKARVDELSTERYRPLLNAINAGDVALTQEILAADTALVNAVIESHDRTALHLAAWKGKTEIVELLLRLGANPNARDTGDNAYPLHFAAEIGNLEIVKMLIAAGNDVHGGGDTHGLGVLGWATCFAHVRTEVADYLLKCGARHHIFSAVSMGDEQAVRRVVEQDPTSLTRPMSQYENHRTPLHLAVTKKQYAMIDLLLELGGDANLPDKEGQTAAQLAVNSNDREALQRFEAHGIQAPTDTQDGTTFSHITPILNVNDGAASVDYYVQKLGFQKDWDWGEPPAFASVSRGKAAIFLCQDGQGQPGTWLSVWVEDVDALYAEYQRSGALIKQPPTNFSWGCREMNIADLDDHRLRMTAASTGEPDGVPLCEDG